MWSQLSLVTDTELGQLEPEATASGGPWGATTWASARTEAKRDLKIWLEMAFPDIPGVADRVLDRWDPDLVWQLTGGAYTDRTSECRSDTESDLALATVFTTPASDYLYVGGFWEFEALFVKLLDAVNAATSTLTMSYWGDNQWETLTVTNNTAASGATFAKSGSITWTIPTDWERRRLNSSADEYYWVRLAVSAALTAGTVATQVLPIRAPDALKRVAGYLALSHIYNGLAAQAAEPETWRSQGEKYRERAHELFGSLKAQRALWLDVGRTGGLRQAEAETGRQVTLGRA